MILDSSKKVVSTPVQDEITRKIDSLRVDLQTAMHKREVGLDNGCLGNEIKRLKADISKEERHLESLRNNAKRQKEFRDQKKNALKRICENHPGVAVKSLKIREAPGKPRLEVDQSYLMKTII